MKHGANFKDRNDIARLAGEGLDAAAISVKLQVTKKCVEAFMPGAKKPAAKAKKPAANVAEGTETTGE